MATTAPDRGACLASNAAWWWPATELIPLGRFDEQARRYDNVTVAIRGNAAPTHLDPILWRSSELVVETESDAEPLSVITGVGPLLERIADFLAFQLGGPIIWGQADLIDVTPPVAVGDVRRAMGFPIPPFYLNARAFPGAGVRGIFKGVLPEATELDDPVAAALRWFVKSFHSDALHDQFIALWVALELVCDRSGVSVTEPYTPSCGHPIAECPQCGRPTDKKVRGPTSTKYLSENLGVDAEEARRLWKMRQMLHGAVRFEASELVELPALVVTLRIATAKALSAELERLGYAGLGVDQNALIVHPAMVLTMLRGVGEEDISPLPAIA